MKVAIIGYGKMGHEIERVLLSRGHSINLIIDQNNTADLCADRLRGIDMAIEFTTPSTAYDNIRTCIEAGTAIVSGTTGWTQRLPELQELCRAKGGAMIYSSNYSLGVNIAFAINRRLAELMNRFTDYDVRIEEVHHIHKKDAPSGTAITLANDIIARLDRKDGWVNVPTDDNAKIEIASVREGEVAGIHTVTYDSADDTLSLRHSLKNRRALATGAVIAAEFVCGRRGVFTMEDLFRV
ncbi:MAG: 4-hydroxy-tetrahydrodipicolinate reductase [Alistipes sp.]